MCSVACSTCGICAPGPGDESAETRNRERGDVDVGMVAIKLFCDRNELMDATTLEELGRSGFGKL